MSEPLQIVYVLTNPAMPGLVKIGKTVRKDAKTRIDELYTTGVPVPFDLEFAAKVKDAAKVEEAFHTAFGPYRVNPKREFFEIEAIQAVALLKLLHLEDISSEIERQSTHIAPAELEAGKALGRKRGPRFDFEEMGIPVGALLHFVKGDLTVEVLPENKVLLNGETLTLTAATKRALGNPDWAVPPRIYWKYEGRLLRVIYKETYG